jgi:tetratricopeptide (TPR) repeat protein
MEGNVEGCREWLQTCLTIASTGNLQLLRSAQRCFAEQELLEGCPDAALARLEPLLDRPGLEEEGATFLLPTLARTYLELADPTSAEETAREALRRAAYLGHQETKSEALLVLGASVARGGRWREAESAFDEGVAIVRSLPYPPLEGRIPFERGLMETRRGRPERAREFLEEALLVLRRLGAQPYIERSEQALAALAC